MFTSRSCYEAYYVQIIQFKDPKSSLRKKIWQWNRIMQRNAVVGVPAAGENKFAPPPPPNHAP